MAGVAVASPVVRARSSEDEEEAPRPRLRLNQEAKSKSSLSTRASKVFTEKVGSFLGVSEAGSNKDLNTWREKFEQKAKSGSIGVQFSDISLVPNSKSRQELALTTDLQATFSRVSVASGHTMRQLEQLATVPDGRLTADDLSESGDETDETAPTPTVDALGFTEMAQTPRRGTGTTGSLPMFPLAANTGRGYPNFSFSADHDVAAHKPSSITFSEPLEKNLTPQKRDSLLRTLLLNKIGLKRRHSDPTFDGNFKPPTKSFSSGKPLKSILRKHPSCPDVNEATSWITSEISRATDESEEEVEDVFFRAEGLKQYLQFVQIEKANKKLALERKANRIEKDLLKRQQTILETMEIAKAFYAGKTKPSGAADRWRRVFETLKGGRSSRQGVNRARRDPAVRRQLEELSEHVPWFTYLFIVLQVVVLCSVLAAFGGITSVGLEPRLRFFEVLTFRGMETVEHWRAHNIWVGPSQAFLIETGALFAPCMRDDHAINLEYSKSMWINMTSVDDLGCCEVGSRNTAGTTTAWECAHYTAGVGNWKEGVLCTARSHIDSNIAHVVKPCCHGNKVRCKMTTHEHCIFLEGNFFDDGPEHCSQVNCLSPLCKMGGVKSDPVHSYQARTPQQWWRLPVGLFHHQGVIHLLLDVAVQFLVGRQIEIIAGWFRIACIYVICGSMSLLVGSTFNPYIPQVGTGGATCALLAVLFVEVFQSWQIIEHPKREIFKLLLVLLLFLLSGTLPFVDNFVLISGFVFGILTGVVFLPYVTFGFWHTFARRILIIITFPLLVLCIVLTVYAFLYVQNISDLCGNCQYLNCISYTENMCKLIDLW